MKQRTHKLLALLMVLVMAISAVVPAFAAGVEPIPYDGDTVQVIKADGSPMGMMKPQDGTTAVIDSDNVAVHYIPSKQTYNGLHWGAVDDDPLTRDVAMGDNNAFDFTLDKSVCGTAVPVVPLKDDGTPASAQYYMAIPAEDKLSDVTPDPQPDPDPQPGTDPQPAGEDRIDLEIINTTGMFKGLYAYVVTENGQSTLVVALNGSSYHNLIPGTYAQAVAAGEDRSNWIVGAQDADGKWYFSIPLAEGQTYIPVVSVSQTYLDKYENGENPIERAYYPRQFVLDLTARTLTVGDYDETLSVTVKSTLEGFSPAETAQMRVVGGPNSNNFRVVPVLQMPDSAWDQIFYPTVAEGKLTAAAAVLADDKTFTLDICNAPTLYAFQDKEPIPLRLRMAESGETISAWMTVDLLAGTILIEADNTPAEKITYTVTAGGDGTWTRGSADGFTMTVKRSAVDETTFSRFTGVTVDGKALSASDYEAAAGSLVLTLKAAYLETLSAGKHEITVSFDDGTAATSLTVREAGVPAPDTDDLSAGLWPILAILAVAGLALLPLKRRAA